MTGRLADPSFPRKRESRGDPLPSPVPDPRFRGGDET
jgi:hypothetical protein